MEKEGKIELCGSTLTWKKAFGGDSTMYQWHGITLGFVTLKDEQYAASGWKTTPKDAPRFDCFEDAHRYMIENIEKNHGDILQYIERRRKEQELADRKAKEYKEKYHHLELNDVKPESEIYFTDLPSTRLMNIIKAADVITLQDLASMTKSDFMRYRNCGQKVCEEVEAMFKVAGIWWGEAKTEIKEFAKYSDEELLSECKRRGII